MEVILNAEGEPQLYEPVAGIGTTIMDIVKGRNWAAKIQPYDFFYNLQFHFTNLYLLAARYTLSLKTTSKSKVGPVVVSSTFIKNAHHVEAMLVAFLKKLGEEDFIIAADETIKIDPTRFQFTHGGQPIRQDWTSAIPRLIDCGLNLNPDPDNGDYAQAAACIYKTIIKNTIIEACLQYPLPSIGNPVVDLLTAVYKAMKTGQFNHAYLEEVREAIEKD